MNKLYPIKIRNLRDKKVEIYSGAKPLVILPPGSIWERGSVNPMGYYSKYEEITFVEGGVKLKVRRGWENPEPPAGMVCVEVKNVDGSDLEPRNVDDRQMFFPRGIPRPVFVPIYHPWAKALRLEIKYEVRRMKSWTHMGLYDTYRVLTDVIVEARPEESPRVEEK